MEIRFVSTLTPEDEEQIAPAVLTAITALLDHTGISYTLRITTGSEKVFQHSHPPAPIGAAGTSAARHLTDVFMFRPSPSTES